jgi:hypothetical protein
MLIRRALSSVIGLGFAATLIASPGSAQCSSLQLTASDLEKGDTYGSSVAIHGDFAVVGSPRDDPNGLDSGSVYVHDLSTGAPPVKLVPADGDFRDEFGSAVALWGDLLAVGVPRDDGACPTTWLCNSGSVRIYHESGGAWIHEATLEALDTVEADQFGWSVALKGDTLIVGAPTADPLCPQDPLCNSGAAYVFERQGTLWTQVQKLEPASASAGDWFGTAVALDGDRVVIGGAYSSAADTFAGTGNVFDRQGGTWTETARLEPSDVLPGALFGYSVAVDGDVIVVGAPESSSVGSKEGAAHVFEFDGVNWSETGVLHAANPDVLDTFGIAVAVEGDTVFAAVTGGDGATWDTGITSVHVRSAGGWEYQADLAPTSGQAGDVYGSALAVDSGRLLVGARLADDPLLNTGAAYLHWVPQGVALVACSAIVSVSSGGSQELQLHGGLDAAGQPYLLLGSASGTSPGVALGAHELPLVPDGYTSLTLAAPNAPPLASSFGQLDTFGIGHASFTLAPGGDTALVGLKLYHAFAVFDPAQGQVLGVSNAQGVLLVP